MAGDFQIANQPAQQTFRKNAGSAQIFRNRKTDYSGLVPTHPVG